jgi:uncharacterized membrane protein
VGEQREEPPRILRENVEAIAGLEAEALGGRSRGERVSDAIVRAIGRLGFVVAHLLVLAVWLAVNLGWLPGVRPFDPFPFGILTLIVSTEGVLLTLFVLISQNRMSRVADQRAHINLQVSLLAERESTRILRVLQDVAQELGVRHDDDEARQLAESTDLPSLARELKATLPEDR